MTVPAAIPSNRSAAGSPTSAIRSAASSGIRRHPLRHLPLPRLPGAVPVDLEAVPVGVSEIERLADEVVGHAGQRHPITAGMGEPAGEV